MLMSRILTFIREKSGILPAREEELKSELTVSSKGIGPGSSAQGMGLSS
jgi:hypothetical protein